MFMTLRILKRRELPQSRELSTAIKECETVMKLMLIITPPLLIVKGGNQGDA